MTAPLPEGFINVVSITQQGLPATDAADNIFQREEVIRNFWKVYRTQAKFGGDVVTKRCEHFFWRVWSHPKFCHQLREARLMQQWQKRQSSIDLSCFELVLPEEAAPSTKTFSDVSSQCSSFERDDYDNKQDLRRTLTDNSTEKSRTQSRPKAPSNADSILSSSRSMEKSSSLPPKAPLARTASGTGRKRGNVVAAVGRGKTRPAITRKGSSRVGQSEGVKSPRPNVKSPRSSLEGEIKWDSTAKDSAAGSNISNSPAVLSPLSAGPQSRPSLVPNSRKMSEFELPPASSWQSVDSNADARPGSNHSRSISGSTPLVINKDFRRQFLETQRNSQSNLNLAGMRKTGSVVRFAEDVNMLQNFEPKPAARRSTMKDDEKEQLVLTHRDSTASTGSQAIADEDEDPSPPRPGIVRTKSELSMMLSRTASQTKIDNTILPAPNKAAREGNDLIMANKTEDERKVLEMAHKDGVTKAGGVQFPKQQLVKGRAFTFDDDDDSEEETIF